MMTANFGCGGAPLTLQEEEAKASFCVSSTSSSAYSQADPRIKTNLRQKIKQLVISPPRFDPQRSSLLDGDRPMKLI